MFDDHATYLKLIYLRDALKAYLFHLQSRRVRPYTITVYRRKITSFINSLPLDHSGKVVHVTADNLRSFFDYVQKTHTLGGSWIFYRPMKAFLRWYWNEFDPPMRNPIELVKLKGVISRAKPGISVEIFEKMISACTNHNKARDRAILYCLLDSGTRCSEFCSLNLEDVNLVTGQVLIRRGKGDKPRIVRFGSRARRALRQYLHTRTSLKSESPLFATDEGSRFDRHSLRHLTNRRADEAGVSHPGLHDFRRACGYLMHKNGASVREIQLYLGHSSMVVTQRYIALEDDDIMLAHERSSPVDGI